MEPKLSLGGTFFHCGAPNKFRSGLVEPASLRQYSGLSRDGLGNSFGRTSMSGVVGDAGNTGVNQLLYDALTVLQHRGQDAAGIMTSDIRRLYLRKPNRIIRDEGQHRHMLRSRRDKGIDHVL